MTEDMRSQWEPDNDPGYLLQLLAWLVRRYWPHLLIALFIGGLGSGVYFLLQPSVYKSYGTLQVESDSSPVSALSRLAALGGAGGIQLEDERLVLLSREIGWPVVEELGLQIAVHDPQGRDAPMERVLRRLNLRDAGPITRLEEYTRLAITDVDVDSEFLQPVEFEISADADGNWTCGNRSGGPGEPVEFAHFSFTPVFGSAHKAGYTYKLTAFSDEEAWRNFRQSLTADPASEASASILAVRFKYHNPVLAQRAAQGVIDNFMDFRSQQAYGEMDTLLAFINEQEQEATSRINNLTGQLEDFREEHGVFDASSQGSVAVQSIAEISRQRTDYQINMQRVDSLLGLLDSEQPADLYEDVDLPSSASGLEGEFSELASLVRQLKLSSETKTAAHPDIQLLQRRIDITAGQMKESLRSQRNQLQAAYDELGVDLAGYRSELAGLPAANSQVMLLTAEIEGLRQVLNLLNEQKAATLMNRAGTGLKTQVLDSPSVPETRDSPKVTRNAILGALGLMLLVALVIFVRESSGNQVRSIREIRLGCGLRVVTVLPGRSVKKGWQPGRTDYGHAARLTAFLAANGRRIGILHLGGNQGSFETSWAVSASLAEGDSKCLLVDTDAAQHAFTLALGKEPAPGLAEVASGQVQLSSAVQSVDGQRDLLAPGTLDSGGNQGAVFQDGVPDGYSAVVACIPPPYQWATTHPGWLAGLDTLVLALPQGRATLAQVRQAADAAAKAGAPLAGIIMTNYETARDYAGKEELSLAAVKPTRT